MSERATKCESRVKLDVLHVSSTQTGTVIQVLVVIPGLIKKAQTIAESCFMNQQN